MSNVAFRMMHCDLWYRCLLNEWEDDEQQRSKLKRSKYVEHRAKARTRKELASLCGMTLHALSKWEVANYMPQPKSRTPRTKRTRR